MALTKVGKEGITGISNASDATAITITSGELVGIGTTSPTGFLNVDGTGGDAMPATSGDTQSAGLITRLQQGGGIGSVMDIGGNGGSGSWIQVTESGNLAANYSLLLNPNGGNVLMGTTSKIASSNAVLHINADAVATSAGSLMSSCAATSEVYHVHFRNGNGGVGGINTSGTATAYVTSSDYRLKENVDYNWDATTRLKQLKPARFNFISDDTNTLVDGFIAHEVSPIVPQAITGAKDAVDGDGNPDYQGIDQSKLVPLLVKTIQELEARLTAGGL